MACTYRAVSQKKDTCSPIVAGGVGTAFYVFNLSDVASYVRDGVTKQITGITLKAGKVLYKYIGRKLSSSISEAGSVDPNAGALMTPTVTFLADYATQIEKENLEDLGKVENVGVIYYEPSRAWYSCVGLPRVPANLTSQSDGLNGQGTVFNTGTVKTDSTAATVTLSAALDNSAIQVLIGSPTPTAATTEAALDALCVVTP